MTSYYDELGAETTDAARRVGWRHRIEQAYRFEAALESVDPTTGLVLDVGCGLGALGDYLRDRGTERPWLGIEAHPEFALEAADRHEVVFGRFQDVDPTQWSAGAAVAVGTLATSSNPGAELADLLAFLSDAAPAFCLVLLSQGGIAHRAAMALEHAQSALPASAIERAATLLTAQTEVVSISPTDIAVFGWRDAAPTIRDVRTRFEATIDGPWGRDEPPERKAWLALELDLRDDASRWLARVDGANDLASIVRSRLASTP